MNYNYHPNIPIPNCVSMPACSEDWTITDGGILMTIIADDIIREGFIPRGSTFISEDFRQVYSEETGARLWNTYILVIKDVEVYGKGRSDDEALAWFRENYHLVGDYIISEEIVSYRIIEQGIHTEEA